MAVNKRLVVLLSVLVGVWALAVFVLMRTAAQTPQRALQVQTPQGGQQQVTQVQAPPEATGETGSITEATQVLGVPTVEEVLRTPISVDFLSPYFLDVSKIKEAIAAKQTEGMPSPAGSVQVAGSGETLVTVPAGSLQSSSGLIEDATTRDFQYAGFLEYSDGGVRKKKVFLFINGEYVSGFENELVAGRYKILSVESTFILMLDTSDGKVKKLTYLGE